MYLVLKKVIAEFVCPQRTKDVVMKVVHQQHGYLHQVVLLRVMCHHLVSLFVMGHFHLEMVLHQ